MNVCSYEEWIQIKIETLKVGDNCPVCNGSGYVESDCDCCGHTSEEECFCNEGAVDSVGDYSESMIKEALTKRDYHKDVCATMLKMAGLYKVTGDMANQYQDKCGQLGAYSNLKDRQLAYSHGYPV